MYTFYRQLTPSLDIPFGMYLLKFLEVVSDYKTPQKSLTFNKYQSLADALNQLTRSPMTN